jgi:signal peptidase I
MNEEIKKEPLQPMGWFRKFLKSSWGEILQVVVVSLAIVIPFRTYIAQPFLVSGPSMDKTFADGQYLIVDELTYRSREPNRGEVVIFKYPLDTKKYFIKRIIGLPGETVEIKNDTVTIFNSENPNGMVLSEPYVNIDKLIPPRQNARVTLGPEEFYVLGDNRLVSSDSRIWGPVKRSFITGRPFFRLFPLDKIGVFPGQVEEK